MARRHRVTRGNTISLGFGKDYREGMYLPKDDVNLSANLSEFIRDGKVEEVDVEEDDRGNVVTPRPTGNEIAPGSPSSVTDSAKKWNHDPDELAALDLETLNLRVMETDPSVGPFDTVEDAIAQLSADFVPGQPATPSAAPTPPGPSKPAPRKGK